MLLSKASTWRLFLNWLCTSVCCAQELPWHLGSINNAPSAPAAIETVRLRPGPYKNVVAVIDSGIIGDHPSLAGRLLPGYDMQSAPLNLKGGRSSDISPDARDVRCGNRLVSSAYRTHGTEVASLIAGNGANGVYGVNVAAEILPIRLMGACGMSRSDLLDAIAWAAGFNVANLPPNPYAARVINLSIAGGNTVCGDDLQKLIQRVLEKKIFVVAAAGNSFHQALREPATCKGVISVGAIDAENQIEAYTALDPKTVIYAPGGGRRLQGDEGWRVNRLKVATYELDFKGDEKPIGKLSGIGTSYAAPVVSGFISLWLSHYPNKQPEDFWKEMPSFIRNVQTIEKCPECTPKGLSHQTAISQ